MDSGEKKLFGCPVCGHRVSPTDGNCPRCATGFSSSTKFECPFCGNLVVGTLSTCPSCGVDYVEFNAKAAKRVSEDSIDELLMEIIRLEASQVRKEDKKFSCMNCSWMLDGTEKKCPKCGAWITDEISFQCPVCGAAVAADATACPDCGAGFVEEEKAGEAEETETAEEVSAAFTDLFSSLKQAEPTQKKTTAANTAAKKSRKRKLKAGTGARKGR